MASSKHSFYIPRFDGGLNSSVSPMLGDMTQSPELQNVQFDDLGAVGTINGTTAAFNPIASQPIDGLFSLVLPSSNQIIAQCAGMTLRASGNTFVTIPSGQGIFTAGVYLHGEQINSKLFLSNGYALPHKYNGNEYTRWGIPVNSMPVSVIATGITTCMVSGGVYEYAFWGISSSGSKGDYSTALSYTNTNGLGLKISGIPTAPISHGIEYIGIGRSTAGLSGLFWVVSQVTNGVTSFIDVAPDATLSVEAPADNGLPKLFTTFTPFLGRMFGASSTSSNPEYLYYSEIDEPEVFPSLNVVRIGEGDGCAIRSIGQLSTGLVIGKDDGKGNGSLWFLYMPTSNSSDWQLKKVPSPYGAIGTRKMPNFGNMLAYLNKYGIYDFNESSLDLYKSDSISYNIDADVKTFNEDYLEGAYAINFKNKLWLSVPYGTASANNRIYTYDYVIGRGLVTRENASWGVITDTAVKTMAVHQGDLYGGSSASNGIVYQLDTGTAFNGSAIDSYYYTMAIKGRSEHESNTKLWRYAIITVDTSGAWNMDVDYLTMDSGGAPKTTTADLSSGGALFGSAIFGVNSYGKATEQKKIRVTFEDCLGVYLQLRFRTSTANQYFKVHNVEVFYNLKSTR
jgi:hypothetical protein